MSTTMTIDQIIAQIGVFATSAVPFLPEKTRLLVTMAMNALHAVRAAQNGGVSVTQEQVDAIWAANDAEKADGLLARQEAIAKGQP